MPLLRVPVTIITGYLGAGKSTLLQRIIERSGSRKSGEGGMKLAIVMNEFGDIAIDGRLVEGRNIQIAELAGGCVCCSLSGEFGAAVSELLEKVKPEWIVVETTGAAEPGALAYDIQENIPGIGLDAIVTVVDADSMARFPNLGHTGREQIELADILILNKVDLIDGQILGKVREIVRGMNSRAAIVESVRCDVGVGLLFGINRSVGAKAHKIHKIELDYFDFVSDAPLKHDSFITFLEKMPKGIYRSKGFVVTEKGCYLMNYVAGRYYLEGFPCAKTELVFIGNGAISSKAAVLKGLSAMKATI